VDLGSPGEALSAVTGILQDSIPRPMSTIIGLMKYFFYVYTVGEFCVLSPLLMHFS